LDVTSPDTGNTSSGGSEEATENKKVERLPKDSVISDLYMILTGERPTSSELKWRMESNQNLVEIGEDIANGDSRFKNKWVKSYIPKPSIPVVSASLPTGSDYQTVSISANEGGEEMATQKYPDWKKATIEGFRTFVTVFVSTILVQIGAGVDFTEWKVWLIPMLLAAATAGFKALGKYIRNTYGKQDYSSLVYKITP